MAYMKDEKLLLESLWRNMTAKVYLKRVVPARGAIYVKWTRTHMSGAQLILDPRSLGLGHLELFDAIMHTFNCERKES